MRLRFEQIIKLPRSVLFAFHEDPEHLVLLHRGWTTFRMIHHEGCLTPGNRTWFETTVAGIIPIVLGFEHTIYEPPYRFGERLIHGPFSKFTHIHEFKEVEAGTTISDLLEIELPWYYGGEAMMQAIVAPLLRKAFLLRGNALLKLAQAGNIVDRARQAFP